MHLNRGAKHTALVFALAAAILAGFASQAHQADLHAFIGATIIDGTGADPMSNGVVLVDHGWITCVGTAEHCPVPDGYNRHDVTGKWLTPGLIDAHVHFSQTAWADGRPDSLNFTDQYPYSEVVAAQKAGPERYFRAFLCSGVTGVFDVGGFPWTWSMRDQFAESKKAPHIAAAGPLVTQAPRAILQTPGEKQFIDLASSEAGRQAVRYLAAFDSDAVKIWFLKPGDDEVEEIDARVRTAGEEARRLGIPLIVHATGLREAKVALSAGAHLLVHGVDDAPIDAEFIELARANGTVITPTLVVREGYFQMYRAVVDGTAPTIDDSNGCADPGTVAKIRSTPQFQDHDGAAFMTSERLAAFRANLDRVNAMLAANTRAMQEAGLIVAMGTDAGNPLTVHGPSVYEEMELMQAAGLTPMEVLVASTRHGARAMGRADQTGTIEEGKIADILVVSADPLADIANMRQVERVMRAGAMHRLAELRPGD